MIAGTFLLQDVIGIGEFLKETPVFSLIGWPTSGLNHTYPLAIYLV